MIQPSLLDLKAMTAKIPYLQREIAVNQVAFSCLMMLCPYYLSDLAVVTKTTVITVIHLYFPPELEIVDAYSHHFSALGVVAVQILYLQREIAVS